MLMRSCVTSSFLSSTTACFTSKSHYIHLRASKRMNLQCMSISGAPSQEIQSLAAAPKKRYFEVGDSLMAYLGCNGVNVGDDLALLIMHLQAACKKIATLLASPSAMVSSSKSTGESEGVKNSMRDVPKPFDLIANELLKSALESSGKVAGIASEEEDVPVWFTNDAPFVVVFDPLDGSRNIDASIPTGSIFGIYRRLKEADQLANEEEKAQLNVLQRGSRQIASAYVLYSSATILCITVGHGTQIFMLDASVGDFTLVIPNLRIPERGQIYSVNDARYYDWPEGLQKYIDDIRKGRGKSGKKYSARYICSLVADLHRTLMYGGIAMNPRDHLRLVYEGNPLSFLVEEGGGKSIDGKRRILDIQPVDLHQRLPLFLGSCDDVDELQSYGNVRQLVNPGYEV